MQITTEIAKKVLEVVDAGLSSGVGNPKPGYMCVEAAVCYALGLPHGDKPTCVSPALRALKIALNDKNWSSKKARAAGLRRLALIQLGSAGELDDKEFAKRVTEMAIRKQVPIALRAGASIQKDNTHKAKLLAAADRCEKEGTKDAANAAANAADAAAYANAANAANAAAYANAAYAAANAAANAAAYAAANAAANAAAYAAANAAYANAAAADAAAYANAAYANAAAAVLKAKERDKHLFAFAEDVVQILIEMNVPGVQWLELAPVT